MANMGYVTELINAGFYHKSVLRFVNGLIDHQERFREGYRNYLECLDDGWYGETSCRSHVESPLRKAVIGLPIGHIAGEGRGMWEFFPEDVEELKRLILPLNREDCKKEYDNMIEKLRQIPLNPEEIKVKQGIEGILIKKKSTINWVYQTLITEFSDYIIGGLTPDMVVDTIFEGAVSEIKFTYAAAPEYYGICRSLITPHCALPDDLEDVLHAVLLMANDVIDLLTTIPSSSFNTVFTHLFMPEREEIIEPEGDIVL
jgi:hypothetical protein